MAAPKSNSPGAGGSASSKQIPAPSAAAPPRNRAGPAAPNSAEKPRDPLRSCRNCKHAAPGRFVFLTGEPDPVAAPDLLMNCRKGHWTSIVAAFTLYTNVKTYKDKAAACGDFQPSRT